MAGTSGRDRPAVSQQLHDQAHRFDFFQAVRLLQRLALAEQQAAAPADDGAPRRRPVGRDFAPAQEAVRFRALASRSFPAGAIYALERHGNTAPPADSAPEMVTAFMGLTGPQGVLPQHYTTLLIERIRAKDYALRDLLDLFHHRVVSLFYRAWEKYRFAFAYEAAEAHAAGAEDLFTGCLYSVLGLGTRGLRGRAAYDDEATLFYAGHFAHWPRSAIALECLLGDYFQLPVGVKQFQGQWLTMAVEDRSALPCASWPGGQYARLGTDAIAGERVWDVEGKFRVRVGPLSYREFCRLMPDGDTLRPLCQMVRHYVGPHLEFDVQLVLQKREVPLCRLGGAVQDGSRLGWNTWVRCGEFSEDVSHAIFSLKV